MMSEIQYLRYVPHERIAAYEALGWIVEPEVKHCHHSAHAVLMLWTGSGPPIEPKKDAAE